MGSDIVLFYLARVKVLESSDYLNYSGVMYLHYDNDRDDVFINWGPEDDEDYEGIWEKLEGTEPQRRLANMIRFDARYYFNSLLCELLDDEDGPVTFEALHRVWNTTSSTFWIEERENFVDSETFLSWIKTFERHPAARRQGGPAEKPVKPEGRKPWKPAL